MKLTPFAQLKVSEVNKAQERVCILQEELENIEEMREKVSYM